jgi:hypothetical protein
MAIYIYNTSALSCSPQHQTAALRPTHDKRLGVELSWSISQFDWLFLIRDKGKTFTKKAKTVYGYIGMVPTNDRGALWRLMENVNHTVTDGFYLL